MIQRSPVKRSTKPIPRRRVKPRRGPLRVPAYRKFLRDRRCCVCPAVGCDPAHTANNGMRSKGPDSSCAPLCRDHHREFDAGRKAFEEKYGIDMKVAAAAHWLLYRIAEGMELP